MPQFTKYAEGQFCWVDLTTTDIEKAVTFYCDLFGWTSQRVPEPEAGGYTFFLKDGKRAAAAAPSMDQMPSHWNSSVSVGDIEKSTRICEEAGANTIVKPMQIGDEGWFSCLQDPSGAVVYLWQPKEMIGASVASETNTWVWNILNTRDVEAAKRFYNKAFGWETSVPEGAGDMPGPYEEFGLNGMRIAGVQPMPAAVPAGAPSAWSTIFAVENCANATSKAESLGAEIWLRNDASTPGMTFSGINDPTGGAFTIIQMG